MDARVAVTVNAIAGRDEVESLRRLDVRAATRIVFVCVDGRSRSVAAATMARAMAPRRLQTAAVAVAPQSISAVVVDTLAEFGLPHAEFAQALESFEFDAGDIVVAIDHVVVDAESALCVVDMTVGDALDAGALLGEQPRGPALAPGTPGADDIRTRVRFAFGLIRARTQALLALSLIHI